jgi:hypothetical protein
MYLVYLIRGVPQKAAGDLVALRISVWTRDNLYSLVLRY